MVNETVEVGTTKITSKINAGGRNDFLKVIAIISMLVDHVGVIYFPHDIWFRIVGRVAFPIFAYQLALGAGYTSNAFRYGYRLLLFALISQIPFSLAFHTQELNILFVLFLSFLGSQIKTVWGRVFYLMGVCTLTNWIDLDYGVYGVLLPLMFHWFSCYRKTMFAVISLSTIFFCIQIGNWVQFYALIPVCWILFNRVGLPRIQIGKSFFYWFYPIHLLMLFLSEYIVL